MEKETAAFILIVAALAVLLTLNTIPVIQSKTVWRDQVIEWRAIDQNLTVLPLSENSLTMSGSPWTTIATLLVNFNGTARMRIVEPIDYGAMTPIAPKLVNDRIYVDRINYVWVVNPCVPTYIIIEYDSDGKKWVETATIEQTCLCG